MIDPSNIFKYVPRTQPLLYTVLEYNVTMGCSPEPPTLGSTGLIMVRITQPNINRESFKHGQLLKHSKFEDSPLFVL